MNFKDIINIMNFSKELIDVFTDYDFSLNNYFKEEKNKEEHLDLYNEYVVLIKNVKNLKEKYKL